jgi:hypothetical protein
MGLLNPGGCVIFQYRSQPFLDDPVPVKLGLYGDGMTPEFAFQEANWMHWDQIARQGGCNFETIGKRMTPELKVGFIRKPLAS